MEIFVSDVSLREDAKGYAALSFKEKLEVAKKLDKLGVTVIEFGPDLKDKADEVLVKTVCQCVDKSVIACLVGSSLSSAEKNYSLIKDAKKKRLIVSLPVSSVQMEYFVCKKPKAVLELLKSLTEKAVSLCDDVEVVLEDATRAEQSFLTECIKTAIDCGAKTVTLSDTAGILYPEQFGTLLDGLYESVEELKTVKLGVECSNALSLAAANLITAVMKGATVVKLSALKNRDLTPIESFSSVVDYVLSKKGYTANLNKTGMNRILKQISVSSPSEEQQETAQEIGEGLTQSALGKIIKKLGYDLSAQDLAKTYGEYKRISEKKSVGVKEIEAIIASVAVQAPETYRLEKFSVQSSNVLSASANVVLTKDGKELKGLSFGNGAIDAAFRALENIVGKRFELDDFQISSLTEGKEAVGETVVKLRFNGKIYSGRGVSTDIVGASIRAYINAVNKIVYEENDK